ncbi:O-antigen ligase family protein [Georgfuchsia toluolica]|nr:O-antigen ligase family protein [Georgfuchsia toluolica]
MAYCLTLSVPTIFRPGFFYRLNKSAILPVLILLLVTIAYLRAVIDGNFEPIKMLALTLIWVILLLGFPSWRRLHIPAHACWRGVQVYVALNLIGWLIGVPLPENPYGDETGAASILGLLGLNVQRVFFPFSLGVNGFGVVAGLASVSSFIFFFLKRSFFNFALLMMCALSLLLSDSRGALGFTFLTLLILALAYLIRRIRYFPTLLITLVVIAYPLVTLMIFNTINWILGDYAALVRASGGLLSGRDVIWEAVWDRARTFSALEWIFGWGYQGQVPSGASQGYSQLFEHLRGIDPEKMNVHSSALQVVLDFGLIGLLSVMGVAFHRMHTLLQAPQRGDYIAWPLVLGFFFYSILAGGVDLTLNQNNLVFFYLFLLMSAWRLLHPLPLRVGNGVRNVI